MRQKYNIPVDAGQFLGTEIDSIDFKTENYKNKAEKLYLKKKKKLFHNHSI